MIKKSFAFFVVVFLSSEYLLNQKNNIKKYSLFTLLPFPVYCCQNF